MTVSASELTSADIKSVRSGAEVGTYRASQSPELGESPVSIAIRH